VVLDAGLQHPVEGHQAHEGQRGQQDEPEDVERRAGVGGGGDQPERNEAARDGAEEHGGTAGGLRHRGRSGALQGEVLRRHETHRRGARVDVGVIDVVGRLAVGHNGSRRSLVGNWVISR
jgi:hypothetical protein